MRTWVQFFCSTWAPSFLFPGLDRVNMTLFVLQWSNPLLRQPW